MQRFMFLMCLLWLSLSSQCLARSLTGDAFGTSFQSGMDMLNSALRKRGGGGAAGGAYSAAENPASAVQTSAAERDQLYEAYNDLHTLAQDFHKPFDAPAVVVVGHQTSGKSALIEALMGFQFNQVGGGTKTRRPVALKMQYNPSCTQPMCFLTTENGREEPRSLADIQAYIESENKRLERDPSRCFDSREINIRMEYKYCPNMIVIDTPGMLHPPKGRLLTPQQRALASAAREAEALVLNKIRCPDYLVLCVEDTTDWKHATTRNVVQQVDPELSRTVLVTTKLDTKLPQFSDGDDLEDFLRAPLVQRMVPSMLGGPFFTSVPCGRVGKGKEFASNEKFVRALRVTEGVDRDGVVSRLAAGSAPGGGVRARECLQHVGLSRLRTFLEARVEDSYKKNVDKIVPLLQAEHRSASDKLDKVSAELGALSLERLKQSANVYRECFSKELRDLIHGSVKASPEKYGETLDQEHIQGGSYLHSDQAASEQWQRLLELEVGSANSKLFGGAQYHRALREFTVAVRHMPTAEVTPDEIANAAGMGNTHDGVNFMRSASIIAVEKAQQSFEPMLEALRHRSVHIMRKLYPIVEEIVRDNSAKGRLGGVATDAAAVGSFASNRAFQSLVRGIYDKFVVEKADQCVQKCRDDVKGMTRFVTWDVDGKGGSGALYKSLPTPKKLVEVYSVAVETHKDKAAVAATSSKRGSRQSKAVADVEREWKQASGTSSSFGSGSSSKARDGGFASSMVESPSDALAAAERENHADTEEFYSLLQLTEELVAGRSSGNDRTNTVVTALVTYVTRSWRDHFARSVAMKFNCFFLMPFLDEFPQYLRDELENVYADDSSGGLFDISDAKHRLLSRRSDLMSECELNSKLQERFECIQQQIRRGVEMDNAASTAASAAAQEQQEHGSSFGAEDVSQSLSPEYDDEEYEDEQGGATGAWGGESGP